MATVTISSGTTIISTVDSRVAYVVDGSGTLEVVRGGVILTSVTVDSGGTVLVSAGGVVHETTVQVSGGEFVDSGGTVIDTTVSTGGSLYIFSGSTASDTTITGSASFDFVESGGASINTTVLSFGLESSDSATLEGSNIINEGTQALSNEVVVGATLTNYGEQSIEQHGTAISTTLSGSGCEQYLAGGVTSDTTIIGAGTQIAGDQGQDCITYSTILSSGASQSVYSLATAMATIIGGGCEQLVAGGLTIGAVVLGDGSGGLEEISRFGTASDTTISSGGSEEIQSGGSDFGALISGGSQVVSGFASGATVYGGEQLVGAGGTAVGTTVLSGAVEYNGSGGTSLATQVQAAAAEVVFGSDSSASLSGTQYDFGIAQGGTTFNGGYQLVASGAVASGMTVAFGGQQYVGSGGSTLGAQVGGGGAEVVFGVDSGASLSGTQYDYGSANGGTTYANGFQEVAPGAAASGMTVESGGQQYIGSAGTALTTNVAVGGAQVVFGSALGALVSGTQYDFAFAVGGTTYDSGFQQVAPGAFAIGMTIESGGQQYIGSAGRALATVVGAQGVEVIFGSDSGAAVSGTQYVFGVASGGTTFNGGYQLVAPAGAGTALGMTVLAGGQQYVVGGGTASGTVLMSQGVALVHGTDLGATVSGTQYVYGLASGAVVGTGGYQLVEPGGTISAAAISGGTIELAAGAAAATLSFTGGGELVLDASTSFSGTVGGFASASSNDGIDCADIPYVATGSAAATTASWTQVDGGSGTLMVSQGGHTADIALLGQYVSQDFKLSSDGHGGTLVTDTTVATSIEAAPQLLNTTHHP